MELEIDRCVKETNSEIKNILLMDVKVRFHFLLLSNTLLSSSTTSARIYISFSFTLCCQRLCDKYHSTHPRVDISLGYIYTFATAKLLHKKREHTAVYGLTLFYE